MTETEYLNCRLLSATLDILMDASRLGNQNTLAAAENPDTAEAARVDRQEQQAEEEDAE